MCSPSAVFFVFSVKEGFDFCWLGATRPGPTNGRSVDVSLFAFRKLPNSLRFAACISSAAWVSLVACAR